MWGGHSRADPRRSPGAPTAAFGREGAAGERSRGRGAGQGREGRPSAALASPAGRGRSPELLRGARGPGQSPLEEILSTTVILSTTILSILTTISILTIILTTTIILSTIIIILITTATAVRRLSRAGARKARGAGAGGSGLPGSCPPPHASPAEGPLSGRGEAAPAGRMFAEGAGRSRGAGSRASRGSYRGPSPPGTPRTVPRLWQPGAGPRGRVRGAGGAGSAWRAAEQVPPRCKVFLASKFKEERGVVAPGTRWGLLLSLAARGRSILSAPRPAEPRAQPAPGASPLRLPRARSPGTPRTPPRRSLLLPPARPAGNFVVNGTSVARNEHPF